MDSKEIKERLAKGEKLFCPECDLWFLYEGAKDEDDGDCEIIMCANPFMGCSDLDIEAHSKLITNNFNKFYKKVDR